MQQTQSLSNKAPTNLSPSFQDWLSKEQAEANKHQAHILKATAFLVAVVLLFLIKDQVPLIQDLFNHTVIAQP